MNWKIVVPLACVFVVLAARLLLQHPDQSIATLRGHDGPVRSVACSADGQTLASVGDDGRVYLWNATSFQPIRDWSAHGGRIRAVAFGPSGQLVTAAEDHTVRIWNPESGSEVAKLDAGTKAVECVALGKHVLVAGGVDKLVRVWSWDGKLVHTLKGHSKHVHAAALSPDEKLLVTGGSGGTLRYWDPQKGTAIATQTVRGAHVESLAFTPDGKTMLGGGGGMGVKLFDVARRTEKPLDGDDPGTLAAALNTDGTRAASVHEDASVRIWDVVAAKQVATLRGHRNGGVTTVAFIPGSPRFITGGADGLVKVWAMP